jgi:hypothetical protein
LVVIASASCLDALKGAGLIVTSEQAARKTFELVAEIGPAPGDLARLFEPLQADTAGSL